MTCCLKRILYFDSLSSWLSLIPSPPFVAKLICHKARNNLITFQSSLCDAPLVLQTQLKWLTMMSSNCSKRYRAGWRFFKQCKNFTMELSPPGWASYYCLKLHCESGCWLAGFNVLREYNKCLFEVTIQGNLRGCMSIVSNSFIWTLPNIFKFEYLLGSSWDDIFICSWKARRTFSTHTPVEHNPTSSVPWEYYTVHRIKWLWFVCTNRYFLPFSDWKHSADDG